MPHFQRPAFSILFIAFSISIGFGQPGIITTYVGPQLPVTGGLATDQAMDSPVSVILDGAGGYYMPVS